MTAFLIPAIAALIMLFSGGAAHAQQRAAPCDTAKSTAETLDCLNRHKADAQKNLLATFEDLMKTQSAEMRLILTKAQTAWLAYRDAECAWEAGWAPAPALNRVYELSCIADLTEKRTVALQDVQARETGNGMPREFGATPRWLNVLVHDYPDIFWRHGSWLSTDLDCDGEPEQIIPGIKVTTATEPMPVQKDRPPGEAPVPAAGTVTITGFVAVAGNPVTGRPKVKLFELPVGDVVREGSPAHLCTADISLALVGHPDAARNPAPEGREPAPEAPVPACRTALQVTDHKCRPILIYWNGADYIIQQAGAPSP